LGAITKNLKDLAKEMNIAVLCLAQLNRQVETEIRKDRKWRICVIAGRLKKMLTRS